MIEKIYYNEGDKPDEFTLPEEGEMAYNKWDGILYLRDKYGSIIQLLPSGTPPVIPPSVTGASCSGYKNQLINGDFRIWQRGTSFTHNLEFTTDRWLLKVSGSTAQVLRATGTHALKLKAVSSVREMAIDQHIESSTSKFMVDENVTVSVKIDSASGDPSADLKLKVVITHPSSTDSWHTPIDIESKEVDLPVKSGANEFEFTFDPLPAEVEKGLGVHVAVFRSGGGHIHNNSQYILYNVQLEKGKKATGFEVRPEGLELMLCQRYYEVLNNDITGALGTAGANYFTWAFKVSKRVTPTVHKNSGSVGHPGGNPYIGKDAYSLFTKHDDHDKRPRLTKGSYAKADL